MPRLGAALSERFQCAFKSEDFRGSKIIITDRTIGSRDPSDWSPTLQPIPLLVTHLGRMKWVRLALLEFILHHSSLITEPPWWWAATTTHTRPTLAFLGVVYERGGNGNLLLMLSALLLSFTDKVGTEDRSSPFPAPFQTTGWPTTRFTVPSIYKIFVYKDNYCTH
jgi:hypothetical protein